MRYLSLPLLGMVLCGCMAEVLTTTAIQGELQAQQATTAMRQLNNARGAVSSMEAEHAIRTYHAEYGVYPPSLEALVPEHLAAVPTQADGSPYGYNPQTGQLLNTPMAAPAGGVTSEDRQMMGAISNAIQQFGQQTGYYPNTLDDLYPNFMQQLPRTEAGEAFYYNNQNGDFQHPRAGQAAPQAPPRPRGGGSGAGLLGESMTGIGIQQELNRMGSGGSNAAQSRSRQNVQGVQQGHNQNINKQMNELGL